MDIKSHVGINLPPSSSLSSLPPSLSVSPPPPPLSLSPASSPPPPSISLSPFLSYLLLLPSPPSGDIMSPPNLDRLLVLPTGCGEQNLVRLATNWVVADYLVTTEQLSDFIAVKIKNNVQIGMIEC